MTKTYPDSTLADKLREDFGLSVQRCWQMKGAKDTGIAWIEGLLVHAPERPGLLVIVQTFKGGGWEAFTPACPSNSAGETVLAVALLAKET